MTQKRSVSTSLKSYRRSDRLTRDNKNASEPMWFRGVAVSMGLCFDLGTVLEGHPDILFAVDGDVTKAYAEKSSKTVINLTSD